MARAQCEIADSRRCNRPLELVVTKREYDYPVRRDYNVGGGGETVHRDRDRFYRSAVAGRYWIHPVVIGIAVEDLPPAPGSWKADPVAVPGFLAQVAGNDDITAFSLNPAMECDNPVSVVDVKNTHGLTPQRGVTCPQFDQVLREPQKVDHGLVTRREPVPIQQIESVRGVAPLLVLKELLAHEDHRYARRSEEKRGGKPRAAAGEP